MGYEGRDVPRPEKMHTRFYRARQSMFSAKEFRASINPRSTSFICPLLEQSFVQPFHKLAPGRYIVAHGRVSESMSPKKVTGHRDDAVPGLKISSVDVGNVLPMLSAFYERLSQRSKPSNLRETQPQVVVFRLDESRVEPRTRATASRRYIIDE